MNGIENYPAAGEHFLENVILKVSLTHFSKGEGGGGEEVVRPIILETLIFRYEL